MNLLGLIGDMFTPAVQLIDELHTSEDERLQAKAKLLDLQIKAASQAQEYERQLLDAKTKIIVAEASGQNLLQSSWRPITMLVFLVLVVADSFGLLAFRLSEDAWTLLQLGLSGYIASRGLEKIVPKVADAYKEKGRNG